MQYLSRNSQSRRAMPVHALCYLPTRDATEIERSSKLNSTRKRLGSCQNQAFLSFSVISRPVPSRSSQEYSRPDDHI